jgi:hypothetical protein
MLLATRHLLVACLAAALLLGFEPGPALGAPASPGPELGRPVEGAARVAQARRRKPPKGRKPAPKPEPKPEPAPEEPAAEPAAAPAAEGGGGAGLPVGPGGTSRVEFEGMQIKGQTTKAGEVQILERKDSALKSMVMRRTSYREEIIQTVFPEQAGNL